MISFTVRVIISDLTFEVLAESYSDLLDTMSSGTDIPFMVLSQRDIRTYTCRWCGSANPFEKDCTCDGPDTYVAPDGNWEGRILR